MNAAAVKRTDINVGSHTDFAYRVLPRRAC